MERAEVVLAHPLAMYKSPFTLSVMHDPSTGEVLNVEMGHNLIDLEPLVFLATMIRPVIFTQDEPTYFPSLVNAIGHEHEALRPHTRGLGKAFKDWSNRVIIGITGVGEIPPDQALEEPVVIGVRTAPVGAKMLTDEEEANLVPDMYYARVYLNGFVWHNDADKTAEYRAVSALMQQHYRKCAELRVFSAIQQIVRPLHQYVLDARRAGEDL